MSNFEDKEILDVFKEFYQRLENPPVTRKQVWELKTDEERIEFLKDESISENEKIACIKSIRDSELLNQLLEQYMLDNGNLLELYNKFRR